MANLSRPLIAPRQLQSLVLILDPVAPPDLPTGGTAPTPTDFGAAISHYQLAPSQTVSTWRGGTPADTFSAVTAPTYQATITMAQDEQNTASFHNYLLAHAGERHWADYQPNGAAKVVRALLLLAVPPIGGDVDAWLTGQITCGVQGVPQIVNPAA